jgi:hypothetical protein
VVSWSMTKGPDARIGHDRLGADVAAAPRKAASTKPIERSEMNPHLPQGGGRAALNVDDAQFCFEMSRLYLAYLTDVELAACICRPLACVSYPNAPAIKCPQKRTLLGAPAWVCR